MSVEDETLLPGNPPLDTYTPENDPLTAERIRRLVTEHPYGVFCTQGQRQPWGSLVAFAFSEDPSSQESLEFPVSTV